MESGRESSSGLAFARRSFLAYSMQVIYTGE
jgi:hypothetical protein